MTANPLFDRRREARTTTINGVPVHRLMGKLPAPRDCPECAFPVFELDDPDARAAGDDLHRVHLTARMEWRPAGLSFCPSGNPLLCAHPYHLIQHHCNLTRPRPAFPAGLIAAVVR